MAGLFAAACKKRHVGAVGAKLYYPDKDKNGQYRMQHVGITNMGIGPAHKLGWDAGSRLFWLSWGTIR